MRVLLDTHVVLAMLKNDLDLRYGKLSTIIRAPATTSVVSVASLWEISIKTQLGKVDPGLALEDIEAYIHIIGLTILPISAKHAVTVASPEPVTRDPFDRLLLAQCQVEGLLIATVDRALVQHRLALKV